MNGDSYVADVSSDHCYVYILLNNKLNIEVIFTYFTTTGQFDRPIAFFIKIKGNDTNIRPMVINPLTSGVAYIRVFILY